MLVLEEPQPPYITAMLDDSLSALFHITRRSAPIVCQKNITQEDQRYCIEYCNGTDDDKWAKLEK